MRNSKKEAYLNAYKGSLLEYLVALEFAKKFDLFKEFIGNLNHEYKLQLQSYELAIRNSDRNLLNQLGLIARRLSTSYFDFIKPEKITEIMLTSQTHESEADLILVGERDYKVSIKLCKVKSYINTKSAGAKSFFEKYFNDEKTQKSFNKDLDLCFDHFSRQMFEFHDLDYESGFVNWPSGFTELPGELKGQEKNIYQEYMKKVSSVFYDYFKLSLDKPEKLSSLLGFSSKDIDHLICFHSGTDEYQVSEVLVDSFSVVDDFKLLERPVDKFSFELSLDNKLLQIRCKPMNKFSAPSLKINCSVKYLGL